MSDSNEIDEFAGISPAPPARSPVLALVIIGLALVTVFHLRADIRYALSPRSAAPLEELRGAGLPYLDRHVRVHGVPDRRDSLIIEPRGGRERESFFRLLDADPPIFVRALDTADRTDLSASWTGRLRRFSDVSYASSLRDYFAKAVEVEHYLDIASVKAAAGRHETQVVDRLGRPVNLNHVAIEIDGTPTEYALEMQREKFPSQADAQHELERILQKLGVTMRPLESDPSSFRFATPMLEAQKDHAKRAQLFATLSEADIDFMPEVPTVKTSLDKLCPDQDTLVVRAEGGDCILGADPHRREPSPVWQQAWSGVRAIYFFEPLHIDDQALVLTEGEAPAGFVWAPLVAALLLALAAFNVWYLLRPRRAT